MATGNLVLLLGGLKILKFFKLIFRRNRLFRACLLEIARELFEKHFSQKFLVQEVKSIKYLKLIEPTKASVVTFQFIVKEFTENRYKVQIEVLDLKNVFTKLILFFTPITDE